VLLVRADDHSFIRLRRIQQNGVLHVVLVGRSHLDVGEELVREALRNHDNVEGLLEVHLPDDYT